MIAEFGVFQLLVFNSSKNKLRQIKSGTLIAIVKTEAVTVR
jgi:hypothetical protein